ncbi:xylulokinase [Roseicyclus sp. F158]|uniref:Xylulose kinase n=1 Tax=Tropicimonas omnivorans TaxID=3075590 RepID=A0ABU3DFJ6_9RHOB|nr:xylulokinase [Roseicyclus sp. F158]MDT0682492.1 xylulokinase [Roseicyclus sp. F158]
MYLGLDLGTSGLKALLIGEDQAVLAEAHAPLTVSRPHAGWSEQDPAAWIAAAEAVLEELGNSADLSGLRGIGLSGQMHGAVLLGAGDEVLRPCILWNDTRSHVEAAALDADPRFRDITGNIVFPGFTAPKIAWVRANEPEIAARIERVLLPKDYLRLWLTGAAVSDMSDAAGTAWLDVGGRDWSEPLLDATGLSRDAMPDLVEGSDASGTLRGDLAARFGLPEGVIVAGGGGDNAASAIGVGVVQEGQAFLSLGTSGVLFAAAGSYAPDAASAVHTFCHAVPRTWHQMGVILAASDALEWHSQLTGTPAAELTSELGDVQAPGRTRFLPYLGGERTPHNDAHIRGALTGIEHATHRAAMTRAILEGVSFAFRDSLEALTATGTQIERLTAVGGGSRSDHWLSMLASVLGRPVDRPVSGDFGGAFGAARLALMADRGGVTDAATAAELAPPPQIARSFEPDPALADAFTESFQAFQSLYTALKDQP